MADMTDVSNALVSMITATVYPNGTSQPPLSAVQAKVYPGWPDPATLQADLASHIAHISVFPTVQEKVTTRRIPEWQQVIAPAPTLAAAVAGTAITLSGTVSTPQGVDLIVDGVDYAYAVQANDSLASIAAALAALVSVNQAASSTGPVITIAGSHKILARIVSSGTSAREVSLEQRVFKVSIWADTFDRRDSLAKPIHPMLADITRIAMPDGTWATAQYSGSQQIDTEQKENIYRRDINLSIEYSTILTRTDTTVGIVQIHPSVIAGTGSAPLPITNQ